MQGGPDTRRLRVDLDARGDKAMPQPCVSCHGGRLRPLDRNGDFVASDANDPDTQIGDVKAHLQAFEVDTFEFSDEVGYRRIDLEEGLRKLNAAVFCSYPGSAGHGACTPYGGGIAAEADPGQWSGDFAREMLENWYGLALDVSGSEFDDSYVPVGWRPSVGGPPSGADKLFEKVVGPNCFVCHGKQGSELGTNSNSSGEGKDVDFSDWDKFISHADDIERLVFDEGRMPLGLLNFQNFWNDPEKAELLASFIAPYVSNPGGFQSRRIDDNGDIIEPGERIVARAGPDRVTGPDDPITLDAQASLFADSYQWQLVSGPGAASLSSPNSRRTDFSAGTDGEYVLRMTATSSEMGTSRSDTVTILVDSGLGKAPRSLTFYDDITDILSLAAPLGGDCDSCHTNGGIAGIPVWWTGDGTQPFAVPPAGIPSLGLYEQFMARVIPDFVDNSLVLKKPSGNHHYGGQISGFDTSVAVGSASRSHYDLLVNWIAEGAVCGGTVDQCP